MRTIAVLVFLCLGLGFGCVHDEATAPTDEVSEENLGETTQESTKYCNSHCDCGGEEYCGTGGICTSFVIGPSPAPCGSDCNCSGGQRCTNMSSALGSYGSCVSPSCSAQYSPYYVPAGGTNYFHLSSSNMPSGSYSRLYGTRDGYWDEFGSVYYLTSGTFQNVNSPGRSGYYMRYVDMHAPNGQFWCRTQQTYTYFAP